ncbi:hypothetical protein PDJAM_G00261580 [Pangasius djambal]|nr:hypothetical protein [Pangasius djambal]
MEEFLYEKLDRKIPTRVNNHELLGECMIDAGHEFGPGTAYGENHSHEPRKTHASGSALIKCGEVEKQLGGSERELIQSAAINFLTPFRNFIDGDYKTISKERKLLQVKRLDLDAAKTRLKKARVADARSAGMSGARYSSRAAVIRQRFINDPFIYCRTTRHTF